WNRSSKQESTITEIDTAGDIDGIIRGKKRCEVGDVFRHPDSFHQRSLGELFVRYLLPVGTHAHGSHKFSHNRTRTIGTAFLLIKYCSSHNLPHLLDTVHSNSFGA